MIINKTKHRVPEYREPSGKLAYNPTSELIKVMLNLKCLKKDI